MPPKLCHFQDHLSVCQCGSRPEAGFALLVTLGIIMVVSGLSVSFIAFMNRAQTQAGERYRRTAAMAAAEAGVYRALQILEAVAPDGSLGRDWRPVDYSEVLQAGSPETRVTLSVSDGQGGAVLVTSTGQVSGVSRRLRARVHLASPALLAAVYSPGVIYIGEPPASVSVINYNEPFLQRPWAHIATGKGIWFTGPGVAIKGMRTQSDMLTRAPNTPVVRDMRIVSSSRDPVRLMLAGESELLVGGVRRNVEELRTVGVDIDGVVIRREVLPSLPHLNRSFYRSLAAANMKNAKYNEAAGRFFGDSELAEKRDSLYSEAQFARLHSYLRSVPPEAVLDGTIYVTGVVELLGSGRLRITDGALVCEGSLFVGGNVHLEIVHSVPTRTLPSVVTLDDGGLKVNSRGFLRVDGLVYSSGEIEFDNSRVEVVGAILSADSNLGFRNSGSVVTIYYDSVILGTPALFVPKGSTIIAWVASWEELP